MRQISCARLRRSLESAPGIEVRGETPESFKVGTLAGAGSFDCESCGFSISLHERDEVPACPQCGGSEFKRSSMFDHTVASEPVGDDDESTDWLENARDALVSPGDYLAFQGPERVQVVPLQEGWTRIGRSISAHVRFDDPTVSRRHALLYRDERSAKVLDDRSLNGVFVDGERVELGQLEDGCEIAIGRFRLHFIRLAGAPGPGTGGSGESRSDVGSAVG
ncbi:MAG: FHA domain-containing protein [Thermoleophilaceae bacterium]